MQLGWIENILQCLSPLMHLIELRKYFPCYLVLISQALNIYCVMLR